MSTATLTAKAACCPGLHYERDGDDAECTTSRALIIGCDNDESGGPDVPFVVEGQVFHHHSDRWGVETCGVVALQVYDRNFDFQVTAALELGKALIAAATEVARAEASAAHRFVGSTKREAAA